MERLRLVERVVHDVVQGQQDQATTVTRSVVGLLRMTPN